jgi:hypothetical protein
MGGKYKILPVDVLVLAGLYAAGLMNYFLFHRLAEVFCHCGYQRHRYAPETVTGSRIIITLYWSALPTC